MRCSDEEQKVLIADATDLITRPVAEQPAAESKIWPVSIAGKCQIGWRKAIAATIEGQFPGPPQKQTDLL